jgi:hypothetical protein
MKNSMAKHSLGPSERKESTLLRFETVLSDNLKTQILRMVRPSYSGDAGGMLQVGALVTNEDERLLLKVRIL